MEMLEAILPVLGILMCSLALLPLGLWAAQSLAVFKHNRQQFRLSQELLRKQILSATAAAAPQPANTSHSANASKPSVEPQRRASAAETIADGSWKGFRFFRVAKLVKETNHCTSVYLQPEDGGLIAAFQPGQHLPLRFSIPGQAKPIVRCYSLSDGPGKKEYRISVKAVPGHAGNAPGVVSQFVNTQLAVGDRIESRAPSGSFYLDQTSQKPLVLLAGGIGITPMISMIEQVRKNHPNRLTLLVYGVRNKADQAFANYLHQAVKECENIHAVHCYSNPSEQDVEGVDYHIKGFASVDLLKQLLPNNDCQFYLCGPPPFMDSLHRGLLEWSVPESQVFTEAFGPASIGKKPKPGDSTAVPAGSTVTFSRSNQTIAWPSDCESLLELAEEHDVEINFGCRAGGCGTCAVELLSGSVSYPEGQEVECQPELCLTCIARPDGPVELGA